MIAALRAELVKLRRRRVLIVTAATTLVFAFGSAAIVLASVSRMASPDGRGVTYASLADAGGGTKVFTTAVSFAAAVSDPFHPKHFASGGAIHGRGTVWVSVCPPDLCEASGAIRLSSSAGVLCGSAANPPWPGRSSILKSKSATFRR